jgi:hypothetical protein
VAFVVDAVTTVVSEALVVMAVAMDDSVKIHIELFSIENLALKSPKTRVPISQETDGNTV